jgi:AcrR family transcriptional regulator
MSIELYNTNKKYKELIETTWSLIFKYGIKRITVEEICNKADVSKVTFYKFFRNKEDLVLQVMDIYTGRFLNEYHEIINKNISFLDKIESVINLKISISQNYSNDFIEEIFTLISSDGELNDFHKQAIRKSTQYDFELFSQGQKEGYIRDDIKPEFFLYFFEQGRIMVNDEKLKSIIPDLHERIKLLVNVYYYGFVRRDRNSNNSV